MKQVKNGYIRHLFLGLVVCVITAFTVIALSWSTLTQEVEAAALQESGLPVISFTSGIFSIDEDQGPAIITVRIDVVPTQPVTVTYRTFPGTAEEPSDYIDTSGILTFTTENTQSFNVTINDDTVFEGDKTVNLVLQEPYGAVLGTQSVAILTIKDDELEPTNTPTPTTGAPPVFSDAYEPNDSFVQAGTVVAGGEDLCDITLWPIGDVDYFKFSGKAGSDYRVKTDDLDAGLDTILTVYDTQGNQIAFNDDVSPIERRSQVRFTADQDGFYFAKVTNQDPSDPADKVYCLTVEVLESFTPTPSMTPVGGDDCEYNSTIETACLIGVGETLSLNFVPVFGNERDTDIFRLWVKAGLAYTCETTITGSPQLADTNIILWDQNGDPFNPWIGNDDKEPPGDGTIELGSEVSYLATYTGWLHIVVGPVNPPAYEESALHTYTLTCLATQATATPTPTETLTPTPFVPPSNGGGISTSTPAVTNTPIVFPTFPPTVTPFMLPTNTPTPTPPSIQFQPLPTATPFMPIGQTTTINVTLYYDRNNNFTPELTEGIVDVAVALYDNVTGQLLSFGYTNDAGMIRFTSIATSGPVRVSVPYLNYSQVVVGGDANLLLRVAPQPLPIGIP